MRSFDCTHLTQGRRVEANEAIQLLGHPRLVQQPLGLRCAMSSAGPTDAVSRELTGTDVPMARDTASCRLERRHIAPPATEPTSPCGDADRTVKASAAADRLAHEANTPGRHDS